MAEHVQKYEGQLFRSHFAFNKETAKKVREIGSLTGYDGLLHLPYLIWDIDGEGCVDKAQEVVAQLIDKAGIEENDIRIFFSGNKGFHVEVPYQLLDFPVWIPAGELLTTYRGLTDAIAPGTDRMIYVLTSIYRIEYSEHKSGLYKIPITLDTLREHTFEEVRELAATRPEIPAFTYPSITEPEKPQATPSATQPETQVKYRPSHSIDSGPSDAAPGNRVIPQRYVCGMHMEEADIAEGDRHRTLFALSTIYRHRGFDHDQTLQLLRLKNAGEKDDKELVRIARDTYVKKYRPPRCDHELLKKFCDARCSMYEATQGTPTQFLEATDLLTRTRTALAAGSLEVANFNTLLPIHYSFMRGEMVVFTGGAKTGKTSFIHNWFLTVKQTILNIHLEMEQKQEVMRLIQVKEKMVVDNTQNVDQVQEAIKASTDNSLVDGLEHIQFWTESVRLDKIMDVIERAKTDIVFIDSLGCISIKQRSSSEADTAAQGRIITQLQHQAKRMGHLLIIVHHLNKKGDPYRIKPTGVSGIIEIIYQADHLIGFEKIRNQDTMRRLTAVISRRHSDLSHLLIGNPQTLGWSSHG